MECRGQCSLINDKELFGFRKEYRDLMYVTEGPESLTDVVRFSKVQHLSNEKELWFRMNNSEIFLPTSSSLNYTTIFLFKWVG